MTIMPMNRLFDLNLTNIPLINLRTEFRNYFALLSSDEFKTQFEANLRPLETPYLIWFSYRSGLLTFLLQRAILGLESYLRGGVFSTLGHSGNLDQKASRHLRNPFTLGGKGTADNFYNCLPGLVSENLKLVNHNNELWLKTKRFYDEIRNPLFHGQEIESSPSSLEGVRQAYGHIAELYGWIDSWFEITWPSGQKIRF